MSPLVRLCCALAALALGAALYTNTAFSSAGSPPPGPGGAADAKAAAAYAVPAAATATPATSFMTVNSLSDAAANDGLCTLREAITSANTQTASGAASGECPAGAANNFVSTTVTGTIVLTSALPNITSNLIISGTGANFLTVSGNNANRVFVISAGATVTMSDLTISGGRAAGSAGLFNNGTLTINNSVISNNHATPSGSGGGLSNCGTLAINNSTISNNSAADSGGGLITGACGIGSAVLTNTTVSSNSADRGGGIVNLNALTLNNSTVTGNTATTIGGGVYNPGIGFLNFSNTIIAGNSAGTSGPDCNGANVNSQDYNLVGNTGACNISGTTTHNVTGVDAKLGPLKNDGGLTPTHALLPGSPALDAGNAASGTDQRGSPRPVDLVGVTNAAGGNGSDIGAFEAGPTELLTVNSLLDTTDGTCDSLNCTLREALVAANASADRSAIYFSVTGTINLSGALPDITTGMTISGPGSGLLTVRRDTGGNYRIFTLNSAAGRNISGLTLSNGRTPDGAPASPGNFFGNDGGAGGGISNAGTLALKDVVVTGNRTGDGGVNDGGRGGWGGPGGGIYNTGTLTLTNAVVSNNTTGSGVGGSNGGSGGRGGGIYSAGGALTMTNVHIVNNRTGNGANGLSAGASGGGGGDGGGILLNAGSLSATNVTISGNATGDAGNGGSAGHGGGLFTNTGLQATLVDAVVSNNATGNGGGGTAGTGGLGGGIINHGSMTVTRGTVSGNITGTAGNTGGFRGGSGGGIFNNAGLTMTDSTVSGNSARGNLADGGGIYSQGNLLSLTNCTISNNQANPVSDSTGGRGGGLYTSGLSASLTNVTVTGNLAYTCCFFQNGQGVELHSNGSLSVRNTIIAGNGNGSTPDVTGAFTSLGNNIVGRATTSNSPNPGDIGSQSGFTNGVNGDIVGTIGSPVNALLAALGNYGGATQTHALLPGSPAVNAGTSTGAPGADQRGVARVGAVDIGAFESRGFQITPTAGTPQSTPIKTFFSTALSATVASPFGEPVSGGVLTFNAPASGASGTFTASRTVSVNAGGVATAPTFLANAIAGDYSVTASTSGSSSATFALTNLKGMQSIAFGPLPDKTFGDAAFGVSAEGGPSISPVTFAPQTPNTCSVSGGTVTLLGAGICSITASQKGDDNYTDALDVTQSFSVLKAATATAFSSSPNPSAPGQPFTFTATVTSAAGTPTGSVQFKSGDTFVGEPQPLNAAGVATLSGSLLGPGSHAVTAEYGGDSNFRASAGTLPGGQLVGSLVEFAQSAYTAAERDGGLIVNVRRTGDTSTAVDVDYATDDGSVPSVAVLCSDTTGVALDRCDFTKALGTLHFAAGDTEKSFKVLISDDSYNEGAETAMLRLSNPAFGATLGALTAATLNITDDSPESSGNPVDDDEAYVRQHYHDFLNREPDAEGLKFWTDSIRSCGADAACREVKRIDTSAAFFLSIEFQETGYLAYRMDKVAYGDATSPNVAGTVPVVRLNEFLTDTQRVGAGVVVNSLGWEQKLEDNKRAYAREFAQRPRFWSEFPATMTAAEFIDKLDRNAGRVLSDPEKSILLAMLGSTPADFATRGGVLRWVAEHELLRRRELNRAFVLMQYFGYLRRNPDEAPEHDLNYGGWKFWLSKLDEFDGDFRRAEMVKAFITSIEYRQRFGQ